MALLRKLGWLSAGLLVVGWGWVGSHADVAVRPEYEVKAAFLYNFVKLAEWPETAFATTNAPLTVGVLGDDPFGTVLDRVVKDKTINGHPLTVRRFATVEKVADCQLLFITRSEMNWLPEILAHLKGKSVLTVSDAPGFVLNGGMIRLVKTEEMISFEVCDKAAARAGVRLSSKLLRLATITCPPAPKEIP